MPKTVIGIVSFNSSDDEVKSFADCLKNSVRHLESQSPGRTSFEVWVKENGQRTLYAEPSVFAPIGHRLMEPVGLNDGFGRGTNLILEKAFADSDTEAVLLANPDGALHPAALWELARAADPNAVLELRQFPEEHPKPYDFATGETNWSSGCAVLIPRAVWEKVGGFDPRFFMYMEDVDFSWRVRARGFRCRVVPRALYFHPNMNRAQKTFEEVNSLKSGILLAWKWRNELTRQNYERILVEKYGPSAMDDVELEGERMPEELCKFADFRYPVGFSPIRWRPT